MNSELNDTTPSVFPKTLVTTNPGYILNEMITKRVEGKEREDWGVDE